MSLFAYKHTRTYTFLTPCLKDWAPEPDSWQASPGGTWSPKAQIYRACRGSRAKLGHIKDTRPAPGGGGFKIFNNGASDLGIAGYWLVGPHQANPSVGFSALVGASGSSGFCLGCLLGPRARHVCLRELYDFGTPESVLLGRWQNV